MAWLLRNPSKWLSLLGKSIRNGSSGFMTPAIAVKAVLEEKERTLYHFNPTEALLHRAFAHWLDARARPHYSPMLHSYQKGKSAHRAVKALRGFLMNHRKERPLHSRGLFVMKRDISAYTDSIPVHEHSPLWKMLRDRHGLNGQELVWAKEIIRPVIHEPEGADYCNLTGVPTGSPVSCILFNLYLLDLDSLLGRIPGLFYARYSDDLILIHESKEPLLEAERCLIRVLKNLELDYRSDKAINCFWSGHGGPSQDRNWQGSSVIEFLGSSIHFSGAIGLRKKRLDALRETLEIRARAIGPGATPESGLRELCLAIKWTLDPDRSSFPAGNSVLLRNHVTDRGQLKELDDWIYRLLLRIQFGSDSPRVIRQFPPRLLREWGLPSLVASRNAHAKK